MENPKSSNIFDEQNIMQKHQTLDFQKKEHQWLHEYNTMKGEVK